MQNADQGTAGELTGEGLRVGIVRARFNDAVTSSLATACYAELDRLDVEPDDIKHVTVPGVLEIPLALKVMADSGDFDALIALGCVIRGETYHFEVVANESAAGVMRVALNTPIVIANAILTVENEEQAWARASEKGRDAARVAVEMANLLDDLA